MRRVTKAIKDKKADLLFIAAPENVAWLLNIRGYDCEYSPIPKARIKIRRANPINN